MIKTELAVNMGDGWETARRLDRPDISRILIGIGSMEAKYYPYAIKNQRGSNKKYPQWVFFAFQSPERALDATSWFSMA